MTRPIAPAVTALLLTMVGLTGCMGSKGRTPAAATTTARTTIPVADATLPAPPSSVRPPSSDGSGDGGSASPADGESPTVTAEGSGRIRGLTTPQAASRNLWDAWRDDDRRRGLLYARSAAVTELFGRRWGPDARDLGCRPGADTSYVCNYVFEGGGAIITVDGDAVIGYRVVHVDRFGRGNTTIAPLPETTVTTGAPTSVPTSR